MAVSEQSCIALLDQLPVLGVLKRELRRSGVISGSVPMTALAVLADGEMSAEAMNLTSLAEQLQIDPSVASRQVHQLVVFGAVARVADSRDRRMHRLQVTTSGHQLLQRARQQAAQEIAGQLTRWREADLMTLTELLTRLRTDLGSRQSPGAATPNPAFAPSVPDSSEGLVS